MQVLRNGLTISDSTSTVAEGAGAGQVDPAPADINAGFVEPEPEPGNPEPGNPGGCPNESSATNTCEHNDTIRTTKTIA